jgi:hypothetical protein
MEVVAKSSVGLAQGLAARIIHDLAGAAQGIRVALALEADARDESTLAEARAFAVLAIEDLDGRLTFCRTAFGGAEATSVEVERLAQLPFGRRRGRLSWSEHEDGAPIAMVQAMLVFAQIAAAALIAGGEAVASLGCVEGVWRGTMDGVGEKVRPDIQALAALAGGDGGGERPGGWVVGAFVRALVEENGGAVAVSHDERSLRLSAAIPGA